MARKASKRQLSFSSLLEPDVPLDPRVVLIDDPRWAASLDEMSSAPYAGIDSEGFDDSTAAGGKPSAEPQRGDFDPFASTIRLLQVALPSGVCAVADLGGIGDDRAARYRLYGDEGIVVATSRVTFACVGPAAASAFFKSCGIPEACIRQWDGKDTTDLTAVTTQASQGIQQYAAAVKSGKTAIDTFFVDVVKQGITVAAAKSQLRDITSSLRRRKINKFVEMADFVKNELKREYVPGAGYYQVYKAETLKVGRAIILQPRGEDVFLAGPAARKLLGLPEDRDVRIEPKNLGDFVIYLQSASPTRKLTPGTLCLYDEAHVPGATGPTFTYAKPRKKA